MCGPSIWRNTRTQSSHKTSQKKRISTAPSNCHVVSYAHYIYILYTQVIPGWCANQIPCYKKIIKRQTSKDYKTEKLAISARRALMGGPPHRQGNRSVSCIMKNRVIKQHPLLLLIKLLFMCEHPFMDLIDFYCKKGPLTRTSLASRYYVTLSSAWCHSRRISRRCPSASLCLSPRPSQRLMVRVGQKCKLQMTLWNAAGQVGFGGQRKKITGIKEESDPLDCDPMDKKIDLPQTIFVATYPTFSF